MVFGMGDGRITLSLKKKSFSFGGRISGELTLRLKKQKPARMLRVTLIGERKTTSYGSSAADGSVSRSITEVFFRRNRILDGRKTYKPPGGKYRFRFRAPLEDVLTHGTAIKEGSGAPQKKAPAKTGQTAKILWLIEGALDVPGGIDVTKRVKIGIR